MKKTDSDDFDVENDSFIFGDPHAEDEDEGIKFFNESMFQSKSRKVHDFSDRANHSFNQNKKIRCIMRGDSKFKFWWDVLIMLILSVICITMPYHIAFSIETKFWCLTYHVINGIFFMDIVLIFFTTIRVTDEALEIFDKKEIARDYMKGWFIVDFLSIVPFDSIMFLHKGLSLTDLCGNAQQCHTTSFSSMENMMLRAPKIRKLFRVLQLIRMLKVFKLVKNKSIIEKNLHRDHHITSGFQRLLFSFGTIIYTIHVLASLWIMVGVDGWS